MSTQRIIIPQVVYGDEQKRSDKVNMVKYTSSTTRANFEVFLTESAIVYIVSGRKEIVLANTTYHIGKGELFLLPKGEYLMSEYVVEDEDFKSISLYFNAKISQQALSEIEKTNVPFRLQKEDPAEKTIHVIPVTTAVEGIFETLLSYIEQDIAFKNELIQFKFMELLFLLLGGTSSDKIIQFLSAAVRLEKPDIQTIMSLYILTPITIEKLAMLTGRSPSQFKREFVQLYSIPPHQWLVKKKLEHAVFLLKTSGKNIDQISEACGFVNPTHFSRLFKKEYGVPPSKYAVN